MNKLKLSLIAIATIVAGNVNAQTFYQCLPCPEGTVSKNGEGVKPCVKKTVYGYKDGGGCTYAGTPAYCCKAPFCNNGFTSVDINFCFGDNINIASYFPKHPYRSFTKGKTDAKWSGIQASLVQNLDGIVEYSNSLKSLRLINTSGQVINLGEPDNL